MGWVGLQVPPKGFPPHPEKTRDLGAVEMPTGLPAPLQRYLAAALGSRVPRIESAVLWGRGRLKIKGLWLPVRFRAYYLPGRAFYRLMEITWFGFPILKGVDSYIDGHGGLKITGLLDLEETGEKIDQAQNLVLWGEAIWTPSLYFTDPRLRWEAVDEKTARLIVPFGEGEEVFLVKFDPQTGLIREMSAPRFRGQEEAKTSWRVECLDWKPSHGLKVPTRVIGHWADENGPYVVMSVEGLEYNVDVSEVLPLEEAPR
jgi:hypothetical protein